MRVLLDTHCWLWMHTAPERFSGRVRRILSSFEHDLVFSAVSAWEISIKCALGKLRLPLPTAEYVDSRLEMTRTSPLSITVSHALRAGELPPHHRDPFDRLLVAQAQLEQIPILTLDPQFHAYQVDVIDAVDS